MPDDPNNNPAENGLPEGELTTPAEPTATTPGGETTAAEETTATQPVSNAATDAAVPAEDATPTQPAANAATATATAAPGTTATQPEAPTSTEPAVPALTEPAARTSAESATPVSTVSTGTVPTEPVAPAANTVAAPPVGDAGKPPIASGANGDGNDGDEPDDRSTPEENRRYFWLKVGQYSVLGGLGIAIVVVLFWRLLSHDNGPFLFSLSQPEVARGIITFLIAAATVSIAVLLVMASIMSGGKDLDQRFNLGKEVLTVLVGVLGTIVGFYYGNTKDNVSQMRLSPVALSSSTPALGEKFTLDVLIVGGTPPFTYSIRFTPPNIIPDVVDQISAGPIHQELTIPTDKQVPAGKPITYVIEVKDAKGQTFTSVKELQQSIVPQGKPAGPPLASPTSQ